MVEPMRDHFDIGVPTQHINTHYTKNKWISEYYDECVLLPVLGVTSHQSVEHIYFYGLSAGRGISDVPSHV